MCIALPKVAKSHIVSTATITVTDNFEKNFPNENATEACCRRNKYEFIKLSIQITFAGYDMVSTYKTFSSLMILQNKLEFSFLTIIYSPVLQY